MADLKSAATPPPAPTDQGIDIAKVAGDVEELKESVTELHL